MFGLLPDLTPRDSHSIWYTSSRNPLAQAALLEAHEQSGEQTQQQQQQQQAQQHGSSSRRAGQLLIERSALARLRADEQYMERRRLNVRNFGSGWLKPPGIPKTLHQMREEEKEQKEHAEAMRREALVQELAEAGGAGQDVLEDGGDDDLGPDLDAEVPDGDDEPRDLDDEIPDADGSFGFDGGEDSDEDGLSGITSSVEEASEEEDEEDDDDTTRGPGGAGSGDEDDEDRRDGLVEARMRMADDAYRQAMARGDADGEDIYGGEEELEAEGGGHMLDEEDLLAAGDEDDMGMGMDMDADLDDDIPEAGELSGVYEQTDSEVDISSSSDGRRGGASSDDEEEEEEDDGDISFAPRVAAPLRAPLSPTRERGPRSSMDLSGLLSAESSMMDSSMMHSSPNVRAQRR